MNEEVTARQIEASRIAKERAMSGRRQEDGSKINPNPTPVKTGKPLTKKPAKVDGSKERTAADPGAPARMGRYDPKLPSGLTPTEGSKVKQQPPNKMDGPAPSLKPTHKPKKRYNPFSDGRIPQGSDVGP